MRWWRWGPVPLWCSASWSSMMPAPPPGGGRGGNLVPRGIQRAWAEHGSDAVVCGGGGPAGGGGRVGFRGRADGDGGVRQPRAAALGEMDEAEHQGGRAVDAGLPRGADLSAQ